MKQTKRTKAKLGEKGYTIVVAVFDSWHDQNLKFCADNGLLFPWKTEISQNNKLEVIYVERIAVETKFEYLSYVCYTLIPTEMKGIFIIFFIKILADFVLTLEVWRIPYVEVVCENIIFMYESFYCLKNWCRNNSVWFIVGIQRRGYRAGDKADRKRIRDGRE